MKLALLVGNRGSFPSAVLEAAYAEMKSAFRKAGIECLTFEEGKTRYNVVETTNDGILYHDFLEQHKGEYEGLVICLPNFGDENGIKAAVRGIDVPVLIQAYPDEIGKLDLAHRRDALCGKLAITSVLTQMGVKYTDYTPFTVSPDSDEFVSELKKFAATCRVVSTMKNTRIGVIGARTTAFKSVRYDETLLERYNVEVETYDLTDVMAVYNAFDDNDPVIDEWQKELNDFSDFSRTPKGCDRVTAKFTAALDKMIKSNKLDGIAVRCWTELQQLIGISPCVVLGLFNHLGVIAVCETDVANAVAMRAMSAASGIPAGCLDLNNNYGSDPEKCILFHCGPLTSDLMDGKGYVESHKLLPNEKSSWGCNLGKMSAGEITVCGMRATNGTLAFFTDKGEITNDPVDKGFFGVYGVYKSENLQRKLKGIANGGFHHHAIVCKTDVVDALREALEKYLGYTYTEING